MDSELDRRNWWDEQSCAEFEAFLDEIDDRAWEMEQAEREYEAACEIKAHGHRKEF